MTSKNMHVDAVDQYAQRLLAPEPTPTEHVTFDNGDHATLPTPATARTAPASAAQPAAARCPDWCDSTTEPDHWAKDHEQLPWETIHSRTFGNLVTVHINHQVTTDGRQEWATPTLAIDPHRVELQNGPSMLWTDEAAALAGRLHAATAFALALEAVHAQPAPGATR